jgi:hypothetical protein
VYTDFVGVVAVYFQITAPHGEGVSMLGMTHNTAFYRAEVERLTLLLTQSVSEEGRVQLERELASARAHLADLQGTTKSDYD